MSKIHELKALLKEKALYIRESRNLARLEKQKGNYREVNDIHSYIIYMSSDYRIYHIAYCELRGRSRDEIEKPKNPLTYYQEKLVKNIKEDYAWTQEEINAYNERKAKREAICVGQN